MKETVRAKLALLSAMLIFGTIGIFKKYIPLPSSFVAMARGIVGAVFLFLVLFSKKQHFDRTAIRKNILSLCLSGAAMGFNWILLFEAYNYTSVATATLCYYMAPTFVILLSPIILKEKLTGRRLLCVLLALAGLVLVSGVPNTGFSGSAELPGILLGLSAAALYAAVIFINKKMSPIPAYDRTILQLGSAGVVLFFYTLFSGDFTGITFTPVIILMLAIVCIVHTGLAYALYFGSMEKISAQTLAIFSYLDPVTAVLLSALFLKEPLTLFGIFGAALILGGAMLSELPEKEK